MQVSLKFVGANAPPIATDDIFVSILSQKQFSFIFIHANTPLMEVDPFLSIYFHFEGVRKSYHN
jgi:hypothetical protein